MVKKVAQRAIAAGLAGMMSLGAFAPAAMAIDGTVWGTLPWWSLAPTSDDDGLTFFKRIKGDTRYDTMKKILEACYVSGTEGGNRWINASEAVIASGENFPDALAANGLAGTLNNGKGAPVILTKKDALSSQAKDVLEKMQVQHVYIMGGTNTISQEVEDAIAKLKIATTRVAGADRQETSMKAFDLVSGNWYKNYGTHSVIIATGATYADSLSIAPFAYQTGTPIVLTQADGTLTQAQIDSIKDNKEIYNIIVVGGEKSVNPSAFSLVGSYNDRYGFNYTGVRIDGDNRYETSANIADWEVNYAKSAYNRIAGKDQGGSTLAYNTGVAVTNIGDCYFDWDFTFVATGEKFPDALAGAQLAGGSYMNARGNGYISHTNKQGNKEGFISGSPILLTKEGDSTAEMTIAKNLAWNKNNGYKYYKSATALYANWFDLNASKGTTPVEFVRNYLANGFFTDGTLATGYSSIDAGTDWAGDYLTDAAYYVWKGDTIYGFSYLDPSSTTTTPVWRVADFKGNPVGTVTGNLGDSSATLTLTNGSVVTDVTWQKYDVKVVVNDTDTKDQGSIIGVLEANGDVTLWGEKIGTFADSKFKNLAGTETKAAAHTGNYFFCNDYFGLADVQVENGAVRTYNGKIGTWKKGSKGYFVIDGVTYQAAFNSPVWSGNKYVDFGANIYVLDKIAAADSNFHGIIFGGTASVSKKKAESLDKAVKDTIPSNMSAWDWKAGDDYNTILNRTLLGNEFWAYRAGMPEATDGAILCDYYAPVDFATLTDLSLGANITSTVKGYWVVDRDGKESLKTSVSGANAAGLTVLGKVYSMDFYHYRYATDAISRVSDWFYDGVVSVDFVVNENTGEIVKMPQFYV